MQKLEYELGGALIYRERELTQLTDLGKLVLPMIERTLSAAEAVRVNAREFHRKELRPSRLGLAPCTSVTLAIPILDEVARVIPGLQVELIEAPSESLRVNCSRAKSMSPWLGISRACRIELTIGPCSRSVSSFSWQRITRSSTQSQIPVDALIETAWLERVGCEIAKRFWHTHFPAGRAAPDCSSRATGKPSATHGGGGAGSDIGARARAAPTDVSSAPDCWRSLAAQCSPARGGGSSLLPRARRLHKDCAAA